MSAQTTSSQPRLVTTWQLFALGVNGVVGVGIFFVPSAVALHAPGMAGVLVFAVTGVALVPTALVFATLGRRFDEDGGPVVFARAAFGDRTAFLVGWMAYVSAFFSASAVMLGLTRTVAPDLGITDPWGHRAVASILVTGLALVVASGISISARVWSVLTLLKILPLVALVVAFLAAGATAGVGSHGSVSPAVGDLRGPHTSWLRAGLTATFAFQGFEIVPVIAGQVRSARRAVPVATLGSLIAVIGLYIMLVWACVATLPDLAQVAAPLAEAAGHVGGSPLARGVALGTLISALGISFGMMVTTPRYLSSLAAGSRGLFHVDRMSPRGVPRRALWLTWWLVAVVVNLGDLHELFALSSIAVLMQYGVSAAALVVLATKGQRNLRMGDAWPALPTLALCTALVTLGASWRETAVACAVVGIGVVLLRLTTPRMPS